MKSYIDALNTLPEKLRKAYLEGRLEHIRRSSIYEIPVQISIEPFEIPHRGGNTGLDWGPPRLHMQYVLMRLIMTIYCGEYCGCKPGIPDTGTQEATAKGNAQKIERKDYQG